MKRILFLTGLILFISTSSVGAAIWYVDGQIASSGSGTSWSQAFKTIQEAITTSSATDEIWVKKGNYPLTSQINVDKAVFIYGGFGGTETQKEQRDWKNNIVIVDGLYQVVRCFLVNIDATIDGLTITHGNATNSDPNEWSGGGILISESSSPTIINCILTENKARNGGGLLIESGSGNPTIKNCVFSGNTAIYGGGINRASTKATIANSIFVGNSGTEGGGGMLTDLGSDPTSIINCIFSGNKTNGYGGGIRTYRGPVNFYNCTFLENTAGNGGAIHIAEGSSEIINCILWGNTASPNKELDYFQSSQPTVKFCDIDQDGYAGSNGNIRQNPLFIDSVNGNYHLQGLSPCIDAGTSENAPSTDIEGTPRPQGNGYDMGAYEYTPPTTTTTTVPPADQCADQYSSGKPYILYRGSNLNCPFSDWGLVNYFQHIVPFPENIQNIEYYATVNLNGATGCIDLRVVIENNYGVAQYFNGVTDGQNITINVPKAYFENTNFDGCSSNWFVHTADIGWQFQPCDGGWLGSSIISSPNPGCNLNLNTCCPDATCCTPTAITLSSFTAKPGDGAVTLNWVTETEIDNAGFNIYRAESENGEYVKINDAIIPAKAGAAAGASYQFIDSNVKNRTTYYYKLQDIGLNGNVTDHGPKSATPRLIFWFGK